MAACLLEGDFSTALHREAPDARTDRRERDAAEATFGGQGEARISKAPAAASNKKEAVTAEERDPNIIAAEDELSRALATRVRIHQGARHGRIELHFFSPEEMERVYQALMKVAG